MVIVCYVFFMLHSVNITPLVLCGTLLFSNYTLLQEVSAIHNNVIRHRVNNARLDLNLSEFILLFYIGEN